MIDSDKVQRILKDHPTLGAYGFEDGKGRSHDKSNTIDGESLGYALEFLSICGPIKSPDKCSYHVKHLAEAWLRRSENPCHCYIGSGVMIVAAIYLGFPVKRQFGKNAYIGVSAKCEKWKKLPPLAKTWL